MLIAVTFTAVSLAFGSQSQPQMQHLAREAMLMPAVSTHSIEWRCSKDSAPSAATIIVEDVGVRTRNRNFKVRLTKLLVTGKKSSAKTQSRVANAVSELNSLFVFEGRCREGHPGIYITGEAFDGVRRTPKRFLADLE